MRIHLASRTPHQTKSFGVQVAYISFVCDFLPALLDKSIMSGWSSSDQRFWTMFAALFVIIPLGVPRQLSALRYCSIVAAVSLAYTAVLVGVILVLV